MDPRYVRKETEIRVALLKLLETTPIADISTTALCKQAGISRNTFYCHYPSPAALLETIENEFIDLLEASLIQTQEHLGLKVGDDVLLQATRSLPARQEAVTEAEQVLQDLINRFPTLATKERLIAVLKGNLKH